MKPYRQEHFGNTIIREFDLDINPLELVWHRDKRDRTIEVLEGEGWHFQLDNELPLELQKKDVIFIPKQKYHRVLKGKTDLLIKIEEND
jgi:quercetin dioxygenase-like cupin family protein